MKVLGSKNNFLALGKEYSNYENSDIVIISLPFRKNNSIPKEILSAPKKIIEASRFLKSYDEEQSRELCFEKGICSLAPLNFEKLSLQKSFDKIYKEANLNLENGKFIVTLSGESAISHPGIKAYIEKFENLSILHLSAYSNAQIAEFSSSILQVGIRSQSAEENEIRKQKGIKTFCSREIKLGMYGESWQELAARNLTENVFLNFDLSVFDPSVMPPVALPEPGGLFWDEVLNFIKIIGADKNIVGFSVVNFIPSKLSPFSAYSIAKLVYKILNYAFINK